MKYLLIILVAVLSVGNEITKIARVNQLKREAKEAYQNGDYAIAIEKYRFLVDSFKVADEEVVINLSNAFYESNDTAAAISYYQQLTRSSNSGLRSQAFQQLGVVDAQRKQYEQALSSFKQSLKANPANDDSRYNYELLKKMVKEQEDQQKQDQNQQNKDQQNKDQNKQDQEKQENQEKQDSEKGDQENQEEQNQEEKKEQEGDQEKENEPQPESTKPEKLKEMNISEEKARMILEAMKNNEIQYIQQNKRKAKEPKKSTKPDW
ncbi:MAG TPA: tetratricopeptide repeat protein [Cyclobacteriaceae bacterium]|jgi:hypothetical protein